ncbi:uncharacterized protein LOC121624125 isoform X6 [Chelmon rostratus]|uniref:uncharacterized protein LOC121624125 isoform X6 n=1 Tax=Chelmon rostratus TaxID=109905 RepID=UPI001BE9496D|nr:uncharacterized protein LOC121624125 isoform X6 [Chelmon rostratus]
MMNSFLLLIVSLTTGFEASSDVKGCKKGWVEFTCNFPMPGKHENIVVVPPKGAPIKSPQPGVWKTTGRVSLFHDAKTKNLRVAIKQLKEEDFGEYECKSDDKSDSSDDGDQDVEVDEKDGCQAPFIQTAYRTAKTTITCDYPGNTHLSSVKVFCKDSDLICEDILSIKSSSLSNGTFTLRETSSGFNVSISNVSSQDAAVYWCGVESNDGPYRVALRKIQLEVKDITTLSRSLTAGQNFTYWCEYPNGASVKKFICKGEDPSICQRLASTASPKKNTKFSMKDDRKKRNITITVREVTTDDTGTYWCGAESTAPGRSNLFFNRLLMAVGGSSSTVIIAAVVCVAVLAVVLILLLVYKRFEQSQHIRNAEAQKEDPTYEEIQERPQQPDSGTALKTIYVTANFPTNPCSASHHHSNVNCHDSSAKVSGDTYSTVRDNDQLPTYSTVSHPSRCSEDPFYSTVSNPQQHRAKS